MTPDLQFLRLFYELMVFATHDLLCRKGDFLAMGAAMEGTTNHIEHLWFDRDAEGDWTGPTAAESMRATFKQCLAEHSVAIGIATHIVTMGESGETRRQIRIFAEHSTGLCLQWTADYCADECARLQIDDGQLETGVPYFFQRACN